MPQGLCDEDNDLVPYGVNITIPHIRQQAARHCPPSSRRRIKRVPLPFFKESYRKKFSGSVVQAFVFTKVQHPLPATSLRQADNTAQLVRPA